MKERLNFRQLIAVASMLFGLFFGAGNLIFPVHMGQLAGANSYVAAIGFIVTAVGLPLMGVAAFGISRSDDLLAMSSRVGKGYGVFFTCALYLTIGPLFAIPRCAATSFTIGVEPMLTGGAVTELAIFSVIFSRSCCSSRCVRARSSHGSGGSSTRCSLCSLPCSLSRRS